MVVMWILVPITAEITFLWKTEWIRTQLPQKLLVDDWPIYALGICCVCVAHFRAEEQPHRCVECWKIGPHSLSRSSFVRLPSRGTAVRMSPPQNMARSTQTMLPTSGETSGPEAQVTSVSYWVLIEICVGICMYMWDSFSVPWGISCISKIDSVSYVELCTSTIQNMFCNFSTLLSFEL